MDRKSWVREHLGLRGGLAVVPEQESRLLGVCVRYFGDLFLVAGEVGGKLCLSPEAGSAKSFPCF